MNTNRFVFVYGLMLCFAILLVAPVYADTKFLHESGKTPILDTVEIDGVSYVAKGSVRYHITAWDREEGGIRALIFRNTKITLFTSEGDHAGQGAHTSLEERFTDDLDELIHWTYKVNVIATIGGVGKVASFHVVEVWQHGELVTSHIIGVLP